MTIYRLSRKANENLDEIAERIAIDSPSAAQRVLDAVHESLQSLARNPRLGKTCEPFRPGLRVFPVKRPAHRYLIFYYEISNGIEVAAILHGHRDWMGLLTRGGI